MSEDLAAILEADVLTYIRVAGLFLVFCVALFNFTLFGKIFSIIALVISLVLFLTLTINYFVERDRIYKLGFKPKLAIDILMCMMIVVILLICWMLYAVWFTEQTSLSSIAKEIEDKIDESTAASLKYLEKMEQKEGLDIEPVKKLLRTKQRYHRNIRKDLQSRTTSRDAILTTLT